MRILRMIANILIVICLTNAISGCGSDDNELKQEMEKLLVDKQDSVFLDNGKYVAATTEFTDEEAVVVLKSTTWVDDGYPYIYDNTKIKKIYDGNRDAVWYKFLDMGVYKNTYYGYNLEETPDFEYFVKNKTLTLHEIYRDKFGVIYSEYKFTRRLVAVDKDRIILDAYNEAGFWSQKYYPEFDENKSKIRFVWKALTEE